MSKQAEYSICCLINIQLFLVQGCARFAEILTVFK